MEQPGTLTPAEASDRLIAHAIRALLAFWPDADHVLLAITGPLTGPAASRTVELLGAMDPAQTYRDYDWIGGDDEEAFATAQALITRAFTLAVPPYLRTADERDRRAGITHEIAIADTTHGPIPPH